MSAGSAVPTLRRATAELQTLHGVGTVLSYGTHGCTRLLRGINHDNRTKYTGIDSAKVPEHVQNYVTLFRSVTGRTDVKTGDDLVRMSEVVYNFQRVFNLKMGFGTREHDAIPYRSMGPVTVEEYESRQERYDQQLVEILGLAPETMSTPEKVAALRAHREAQYEKLTDAVYARRGWTADGVPTVEKLRELGIDFPDVVKVVEQHL